MLKFKSVYDSIGKEDGLRILATRFRGRGMRKTRYHVWMANLGPTEKTLKELQKEKIDWPEFTRQYRTEQFYSFNLDKRNNTILNHGQKFTLRLIKRLARMQNITLMCHCETNEKFCHLRILKDILRKI